MSRSNIAVFPVTPRPSTLPTYERPADWIDVPIPPAGTQALNASCAVFDGISNRMAFSATVSDAASYFVDWGDGSAVDEVASTATAEHAYTYASLPASSSSARGYRQALIQVTPATGKNLTAFDFQKKHSAGPTGYESRNLLDVNARLPNISTFAFGVTTASGYRFPMLERFWLYEGSIASMTGFFFMCVRLQSHYASFASTTASTYLYSHVGQRVQSINLPESTSVSYMLRYATSSVVTLSAPKATSAVQTFEPFSMSQQYITADIRAATNITGLCTGNRQLKYFSGNVSAATTTTDAFKDCSCLSTLLLTGLKTTINFATTNLNAAAFAACGAVAATVSGQTVTISAALDGTLSAAQRAVWTDKGWTIAAV